MGATERGVRETVRVARQWAPSEWTPLGATHRSGASPLPGRVVCTGVRLTGENGAVLDHVGFEVSDLARSAAFYDALFHPLGGRRIFESPDAIGYGINDARLWIVARGRPPAPGFGHVAISAHGRPAVNAAYEAALAAGGTDDGAPGPRHQYGPRYYSAYLLDPDGLRVEVVTGSH
jgi:catechol 2,3-dioxygenase-like lactoylglutathione lyase family enzyme